ncbi:MAG: gluconate:H+ symporter [Terracidiphilus sp.]
MHGKPTKTLLTGPVWNNLPVSIAAASAHDGFLVACAAGMVLLLLLLITKARLHPALALAVSALLLGVTSGMPLTQVPLSFTAGVGNLMGRVAMVLGLGAVLGRLLASSGGATALGRALVDRCGRRGLPWAMLGLGILVGMPVFFEVGLVLLLPIVAAVAERRSRPPILVGMPLLAGLSIVHGVLPPHPAAMLAVAQYHAEMGRTILLGLAVGVPAAIVAGPCLGWLLMRRWEKRTASGVRSEEERPLFAPAFEDDALQLPNLESGISKFTSATVGPLRAAFAILLPVALIFMGSWADALFAPGSILNQLLHFIGSPDVALLIAVLAALLILGPYALKGKINTPECLRKLTGESFEPIAGVLVILAAAGGLSGILRDSGAAQATVALALGLRMQPLLLAWLLAAVVRVSTGSATVATAVAAGILAPVTAHLGVQPELLVLATGTGSLILSHVNDPGFWLVQSFFKLEVKETLATWSVLETVLSISGLGMTLLLAALLR